MKDGDALILQLNLQAIRQRLSEQFRGIFENVYERGLADGYALGYRAGKTEKNNKNIIMQVEVERQIEEILEKKELLEGDL